MLGASGIGGLTLYLNGEAFPSGMKNNRVTVFTSKLVEETDNLIVPNLWLKMWGCQQPYTVRIRPSIKAGKYF